jgi:hypothetical protein
MDFGKAVATDPLGNAFAGGDIQVGTQVDVSLRKYDANGDLQWVRVWGGSDGDDCEGIDGDSQGNVFVTGEFVGEVDFDPGLGIDLHISNGGADIFLSKFDSDGVFSWAETWGGSNDGYGDFGDGVSAAGSEAVYVAGTFTGETDFDSGSGTDIHETAGSSDIYLSKFDANGSFEWARTWGGDDWDMGSDVAALPSGTVYATGIFTSSVVDFDPGAGEDLHYLGNDEAAFLSKFLSDGYW